MTITEPITSCSFCMKTYADVGTSVAGPRVRLRSMRRAL